MSEILNYLFENESRGEWHPLTDDEKIELTKLLLHDLNIAESFLNGNGDAIGFDKRRRIGLRELGHLVFNGCPLYHDAEQCNGDIVITHIEASKGRCCKCGEWVSDYWG